MILSEKGKKSQATVRTKENKPVAHKGAAIHVLNKMQGRQRGAEQPGKWIKGIGRLTLGKDGDESSNSTESGSASIADRVRDTQRRCIITQLSRGHKLCTKLVKELDLGILFDSKIWCVVRLLMLPMLRYFLRSLRANFCSNGGIDLETLSYTELRKTFRRAGELRNEGRSHKTRHLLTGLGNLSKSSASSSKRTILYNSGGRFNNILVTTVGGEQPACVEKERKILRVEISRLK
jgi:hypothetical protein